MFDGQAGVGRIAEQAGRMIGGASNMAIDEATTRMAELASATVVMIRAAIGPSRPNERRSESAREQRGSSPTNATSRSSWCDRIAQWSLISLAAKCNAS